MLLLVTLVNLALWLILLEMSDWGLFISKLASTLSKIIIPVFGGSCDRH